EKTLQALRCLADGPLTPTQFAEKMWPHSPGWLRIVKSGNNSVVRGRGMPKAGGSYLGKLRKRGLVTEHYAPTDRKRLVTRYRLTLTGEEALR
ncbi:hypothetical protein LCGC14_2712770, partial [marine sediment metagenome]